jgi:hypothetical protein
MIKIAFLGDISFNDDYIGLKEKGINPFAEIGNFLKKQDFVVGNLECLAKGDEGENELKKPRLKTSLEALNYLNDLNISLVTLAHNHIYDNLTGGYQETTGFLQAQNISWIGAGFSETEAAKPYYFEKDGLKICFLSFLTSDTNPNLPANCPLVLNMFEQERIVRQIQENKKSCDYVILMLHWGGRFEGGKYPDFYQPRFARKFVEAGADAILGHHSHTLQPFEKIKGNYVFYSLGNFCFSDIHFEGRIRSMSKRKYTETLIPVFQFNTNKIKVELHPVRNRYLHPKTDKGVFIRLFFSNFVFIFLKFKLFWNIYSFNFTYIRPIVKQIFRKDQEKSLLKRIYTLDKSKLKHLFK